MNKQQYLNQELSEAVRKNNIYRVYQLLLEGADANYIYINISVLILAASRGYTQIVELLIKFKVDVDYKNPCISSLYHNFTAMAIACQNQHFDIVKLLWLAGAEPNLSLGFYFTTFEDFIKAIYEYDKELYELIQIHIKLSQ
jgi:ankyrin repeat protein